MQRYLTVKQVAELTGISPGTWYQWVSQRKVKFVKLHGCLRFDRQDVEAFISENTVEPLRN